MVTLDEEKLNGDAAILGKLRRIGGDGHAVLNGGGASREQPVGSLHFDDAETTGADGGKSFEIAKRRNVFATGLGRLENRLAFRCADELAVDAD
jgi:hypothetical protein